MLDQHTVHVQERKLNSFHMRCLRSICGVKWKDKIRNMVSLRHTVCSWLPTSLVIWKQEASAGLITHALFLSVAYRTTFLMMIWMPDSKCWLTFPSFQIYCERRPASTQNRVLRLESIWEKSSDICSFAKVPWKLAFTVPLKTIILS